MLLLQEKSPPLIDLDQVIGQYLRFIMVDVSRY